jgi:hypothetical protein
MTLKELKLSLRKLSPDMDDMQVLLVFARDGKRQLECVAFTGYIPGPGAECVAVGGMSEIQRRVEAGEMPPPDGYDESIPHDDE